MTKPTSQSQYPSTTPKPLDSTKNFLKNLLSERDTLQGLAALLSSILPPAFQPVRITNSPECIQFELESEPWAFPHGSRITQKQPATCPKVARPKKLSELILDAFFLKFISLQIETERERQR